MSAPSPEFARPSSIRSLWLAALIVPILIQLLPTRLLGSSGDAIGSATTLFVIVLAVMALASISSGMLISRARRTNEVELGYLGLFFFAISVLSLAHGITTPGVLFGASSTASPTVFWAVPAALVAGLPAVLGRTVAGQSVDAEWQQWVTTIQYSIVAFGALVLTFDKLLPSPTVGSQATTAIVVISVLGCALYSKRHYELALIARSTSPLLVSLGYGLVGASMLMWLESAPYSVSFWLSHFLLMFGTIAATIGALTAYRMTNYVRPLIESIILVDPRCALEVGIEPSVHKFIADLEDKDPITADHIVRTTELAMTIGPKLGLRGMDLRDLGLTALLHDIGMLLIPDTLVNSTGELEDRDYAIVKRHAIYGAEIVADSPALKSIAPAIMAHHEHIDGSGYPKGLLGPQVPLNARIVSVCDAFDALSNTRRYRPDLDREAAIEILERYAGSQWDRRVVETVVRTVRNNPPREMPDRLDATGRIGCDCIPKLRAS